MIEMDLLIAGLVAVAVYIYLGYAMPNRMPYDSKSAEFEESDPTRRRGPAATRLSRGAAIAISLGLVTLFAALLKFAPSLDLVVALAIVAVSLWVTVDSYKVRLQTYETRIALRPIALFYAMLFLWPVFFPWYLITCSKIGDGTLHKKSSRADPRN